MDFKQIQEYIIECGKRYKEPDIEEWEWEDIENLTVNEIILFAIKENAPFSKEKVERFLDNIFILHQKNFNKNVNSHPIK